MKGGRILGSGNAGCILYPQIPCKNGIVNHNVVTKLFKFNNEQAVNEMNPTLVEALKDIDPHEERFVYMQNESCDIVPLNMLSLETQRDIVNCLDVPESFIGKNSTATLTFFNQTKVVPMDELSKRDEAYIKESVNMLHRNRIVHLDLNPGNIMRGTDGLPRIIDFGVARVVQRGDDNFEMYKKADYNFLEILRHDFMNMRQKEERANKRRLVEDEIVVPESKRKRLIFD